MVMEEAVDADMADEWQLLNVTHNPYKTCAIHVSGAGLTGDIARVLFQVS